MNEILDAKILVQSRLLKAWKSKNNQERLNQMSLHKFVENQLILTTLTSLKLLNISNCKTSDDNLWGINPLNIAIGCAGILPAVQISQKIL